MDVLIRYIIVALDCLQLMHVYVPCNMKMFIVDLRKVVSKRSFDGKWAV